MSLISSLENPRSAINLFSSRFFLYVLPVVVFVLVSTTIVLVFAVVPDERVMGAVQRIFYFHVGAAMATYLCVGVLLFGSIFYLVRRQVLWDSLAEAAASVGLVFSSIVLATGMIWGHSAWNVWWRWEPRLVSFLLLWLLLVSYQLLRIFAVDHPQKRSFAALVGILAALHVPIVVYSVKLLTATEQLHPQVVANQGLKDPSYVYTLVLAILATCILSVWMMGVRLQNLVLQHSLVNHWRSSQPKVDDVAKVVGER